MTAGSNRKDLRKQSNNFKELLKDPEKRRHEPDLNIPAKMFRNIVYVHGVIPSEWDAQVDRFYRRLYGGDIQKVNQEKSNLLRALNRNWLTWGRFETALQIMGCEKYEICTTLHFKGGKSTSHPVTVRNRLSNQRDLVEAESNDEK